MQGLVFFESLSFEGVNSVLLRQTLLVLREIHLRKLPFLRNKGKLRFSEFVVFEVAQALLDTLRHLQKRLRDSADVLVDFSFGFKRLHGDAVLHELSEFGLEDCCVRRLVYFDDAEGAFCLGAIANQFVLPHPALVS